MMKIDAKNVSPEVVAVITAAIQSMMGSNVVALKIKPSTVWAQVGRQKLMNFH